jgi:5'-3' exonuclease
MIVLVDADSLIWSSCYRKRENPEDDMYHTLEDAKLKFDEVFMSIINKIEDSYELDRVITFAGAIGNFRKQISKTYKANRKESDRPPLLKELQSYVIDKYEAIRGNGVETDDMVATYWKKLSDTFGRDEVLIVSIDKDYKQFPCLIYDYHYKKQCFYDISEAEAKYNFWEQMIAGDSADNVNYCKGYGVAYCKKVFKECLSDYSYIRAVFTLYKKIYQNKAREKFLECFQLLKLKTE